MLWRRREWHLDLHIGAVDVCSSRKVHYRCIAYTHASQAFSCAASNARPYGHQGVFFFWHSREAAEGQACHRARLKVFLACTTGHDGAGVSLVISVSFSFLLFLRVLHRLLFLYHSVLLSSCSILPGNRYYSINRDYFHHFILYFSWLWSELCKHVFLASLHFCTYPKKQFVNKWSRQPEPARMLPY